MSQQGKTKSKSLLDVYK